MAGANSELVEKFFEAYQARDFEALGRVMARDVTWNFPGRHPYAGVRKGIGEVIALFDIMGRIMERSKPTIEKLIVAENDHHLIECQHIRTNLDAGLNIDHHVCVLWTIQEGKIISGMHFFADPDAVNAYFGEIAAQDK